MKIGVKILMIMACILIAVGLPVVDAGWGFKFDSAAPEIPYCDNNECGLQKGTELVKNQDDLITDQKASEYFQNIIQYLLTFLALVSVVYIIYAGFNILTGAGDEEKMTSGKKTILYVLIGILIIFLAGPIFQFFYSLLTPSP